MHSVNIEFIGDQEEVIGSVYSSVVPEKGTRIYLTSNNVKHKEWTVIQVEHLFDLDYPTDGVQRVMVHITKR